LEYPVLGILLKFIYTKMLPENPDDLDVLLKEGHNLGLLDLPCAVSKADLEIQTGSSCEGCERRMSK
jgi:hypothetical protein